MTIVSAEPTKDFFISMLTRDISLLSALVDLIDNSVDAALLTGGFVGKNIEIEINKDYFSIKDNCGGISKLAAENYAFKFGRPASAPDTPHSVGRFGVGMKRALFKLGKVFHIESRHEEHSFNINVNVDEWIGSADDWNFQLEEIEVQSDDYGTKIKVSNLHGSISEKFDDRVFVNSLISMVGKAHHKVLANGLRVKINGEEVQTKDILIKNSDDLGFYSESFEINGVLIVIKAGVGERNLHQGGWYVYCNDRMIEEASTTAMTGWGVDGIRSYHTDFAFFRGVIEFNSADGAKLPWNTTKTGIDTDNPIYRTALVKMKVAMRKILLLLSERIKEQNAVDLGSIEESMINKAIVEAPLTSIFGLKLAESFIRPTFNQPPKQITERRISYSVKDSELMIVKDSLGLNTNKDVGLYTFRHYLENEC
ncbi:MULTISPECIES: ATP-binding protein [unclassified Shewanella]|uniref:ATP-binding protein n=1 Tax=unclassified Shewanella TaxID=196818 RepID=UPI001BC78A0B|nr:MULTISPECIES: ATP-binding protein [unclassified Shewanella]GIU15780.1 hypothetical protein TUM4444_27560 [Shewanella sp. MBTL60-112-B1]GIU40626.1 hypothetical protein TUM4445_40190 [Shewanella sp. MBTL60-112-B2]